MGQACLRWGGQAHRRANRSVRPVLRPTPPPAVVISFASLPLSVVLVYDRPAPQRNARSAIPPFTLLAARACCRRADAHLGFVVACLGALGYIRSISGTLAA